MVDFRYHLVSLVSVFLALAVGIILGAGPLQNSIGNTLQDQVTELRTSRNEARAQAKEAADAREAADAALDVAGVQLTAGTLEGRTVAVLVFPGADSDAYEQAKAKIEAAGGSIVSRVALDKGFVTAANGSFRNALAGQMGAIEGVDDSADSTVRLAAALDTVLRKGTGDATAAAMMGYFTSVDSEHVLIRVEQEPAAAADAVFMVVPESTVPEPDPSATMSAEEEAKADDVRAANAIYTSLFSTFAGRGPTVALGVAESGSLLEDMRPLANGSTVDSPGTIAGDYNTAFAIAAEIAGQHVDLGSGDGARAPFGTRIDVARHDEG